MATTFTVAASGYLSDLSIYSGSPSVKPADGDSIVLAGFSVIVDYSINFASVTATTGSTLQPDGGNTTITITAATLTNPLKIVGSPGYSEQVTATTKVAKGISG